MDDATLVELAGSGDQAAFAELYERYFDRVYDFLARMVRDPSEAADLTQDTFLKAMNSLSSLSKGGSFKSWLFTIARNTALNRLERASRNQPLEGTNDAGEEQRYDVIDPDRFGNPEEAAEAASLAAVVWEAAGAIDPKYRSILMLHLREGLDSAEIAGVMGVTKNHAYVLVNRMKSALESAVGALALFRMGRRQCAELDAVIAALQIGELTPEARRVIERHAGSCETCQEQRRKLASPFAIFAGMALVPPAPGIKETIFSGLQDLFSALAPNAEVLEAGKGLGPAGDQELLRRPDSGQEPALDAGRSGQAIASGESGTSGSLIAASRDNGGVGTWDGGSAAAGDEDSDGRWGKRRIAMIGAAAVLLVLITGPIAALSFFVSDDDTVTAVAAPETSVPVATATSTSTPTAAATLASVTTTAQAVTAATETPAPETGTPVPNEPDDLSPSVAPAGPVPSTPAGPAGPPPSSPVPIEPAPPEPDVGAAATVTPDAGGPPESTGNTLLPPELPPSVTPVPLSIRVAPPSITPVPCAYSMTATPSSLLFVESTRSATFVLEGDGCGGALEFTAQPGERWIVASPSSGVIPSDGSVTVLVSVNFDDRTADSGRVHVTSKAGVIDVMLKVEAPAPDRLGGEPLRNPCGVNCPPTVPPGGPPN